MSDDVRMRGFRQRADVDEIVGLIHERVSPLRHEPIEILDVAGRVLALDAHSAVDVPPFRRSAMDGYAVLAEDTFGATPDDPCRLRIVGESFPAAPADTEVGPDSCVRIMTGAPVPAGADAVVPVEQTARDGDDVRVHAAVTPGRHVGDVGEDVRKGTTVLRAGRRLRPQDVGLLASLGFARVSVVARPQVALVVVGNELLPAGSMPHGHSIVDSNSPMLHALVKRDGGVVQAAPIVPDDHEALREAMRAAAASADCVLVCGGSSVGQEDYAPQVLREDGELAIHGVAMRPSSPAGIGFLAGKPVFLLPGNPVSCLCAYDFFAGRAVRIMAGLHGSWPHMAVQLPLARKISSELGRTDYVRVRIDRNRVEPLAISGASILSSTTRASGFVIVDKNSEGFAEGEAVRVYLY